MCANFFSILYIYLFSFRDRFPYIYPVLYIMTQQRIRIIVGDAGFELVTSSQKSGALPLSHHISK